MIKKERGITLVSLVIVIALMLIVSSTVVNISFDRFEINNLRKMLNDIELLEDKVSNYYLKYEGLPVLRNDTNRPIQYNYTTLDFKRDSADNENYYILDLKAMEGISLNYGQEGFDYPNESNDVYIINEMSHKIYYVKGITLDGERYYTLISSTVDTIEDTIPPSKPQIKVISGTKNSEGLYTTEVELELIPGREDGNGAKQTEYSTDNGSTWTNITELDNNIYKIATTGEHSIKLRSYDKNENTSEDSMDLSVEIRVRKTFTAYSENSSWLELAQSYAGKANNYGIYGNSVQDTTNGEPRPANPVEIQSVGDLVTDTTDENYGKYKIPITVTNENGESSTTNIYLDEPLRKIGDVEDYIDFETSTVHRNIKEIVMDGNTNKIRAQNAKRPWQFYFTKSDMLSGASNEHKASSNYFIRNNNKDNSVGWSSESIGEIFTNNTQIYLTFSSTETIDTVNEKISTLYNENNPIIINYVLATEDTTETIELPELKIFDEYTKIEVLTEVQPSKIEVTYEGYELQ